MFNKDNKIEKYLNIEHISLEVVEEICNLIERNNTFDYIEETDKNIVIDKELFCILKEKYVNEYEKSIINKFTIEESEKNMILINNKK